MESKKYNDTYEKTWDDFVETGVLGTIYHTRKFINYHPKDRFIDNSLMIFHKEELSLLDHHKLALLLPLRQILRYSRHL